MPRAPCVYRHEPAGGRLVPDEHPRAEMHGAGDGDPFGRPCMATTQEACDQ